MAASMVTAPSAGVPSVNAEPSDFQAVVTPPTVTPFHLSCVPCLTVEIRRSGFLVAAPV